LEEQKDFEKELSYWQFLYHKSHMGRPRIESGTPRRVGDR